MDTVNTDFQKHLETLSEQTDIAGYVAREALEYDNPENFFNDLSRYGCISGMIGGLCRYTDTHAFFDQHYDEIHDLKDDWEDSV